MTKSRGILPPRRRWTPAEDAEIRRAFPHERTALIAQRIGRAYAAVAKRAEVLGVRKSAAFLASAESGRLVPGDSRGAATRFKPGHTSWTTGRFGWTAGGRSADTRFKPGQRGHNYAPIGSERVRSDGYLERKVAETGYPPRDWRPIHHLNWQAVHGPIPAGHALVFRNGDRTNVAVENLELVTRAELARRNSIDVRYPKEVADVIRARGQLLRKIHRMEREREEQDR